MVGFLVDGHIYIYIYIYIYDVIYVLNEGLNFAVHYKCILRFCSFKNV